jgi:uracil-DNA glycosylase
MGGSARRARPGDRHVCANWHLGGLRKASLTETVRAWREPYETLSPPVIPLPHPSWRNNGWIRREPWFERELLPVVRDHVQRLVG